jgi:hypothetical protein
MSDHCLDVESSTGSAPMFVEVGQNMTYRGQSK